MRLPGQTAQTSWVFWLSFWVSTSALGAIPSERVPHARSLSDQLAALRNQVSHLEQGLLDGIHRQHDAKGQVRKIQKLLKLQKQEKALGQKRLTELESTIRELEDRRIVLNQKLKQQQKAIRGFLVAIEASQRTSTFQLAEKIEAPRRKVMANLVDQGLKEIETLRADLADSVRLEGRIQEEKEQLTYLFQDLREQASVLELNRQLQLDFLRRKQHERFSQLENYRKLKTAEAQVESLIGEFNSRKELQRSRETEKEVTRAMHAGEFSKLKGKLPYPVAGWKVVGSFGRAFDPKSGLYIFKKGVDLATQFGESVKAVSGGKVAFAGTLPNYGQVVILDHGDHFYSLYGHMGRVVRQANELVHKGDALGLTGDSSTPLYFEIRARNVAVNPLQWLFN